MREVTETAQGGKVYGVAAAGSPRAVKGGRLTPHLVREKARGDEAYPTWAQWGLYVEGSMDDGTAVVRVRLYNSEAEARAAFEKANGS